MNKLSAKKVILKSIKPLCLPFLCEWSQEPGGWLVPAHVRENPHGYTKRGKKIPVVQTLLGSLIRARHYASC